jgi:FkbM family methyltransferase
MRKAEREAAMLAQPQDERLRRAYFDHLLQFAGSRSGLSWALLPEIGHPLYFRCGSSDVLNLIQVFRDGAYDFPARATPLRILDLGAYCGYAAVYLARRFPQARILCVEPGPDSFRLLSLNTTPWPRIRVINGAAWHSATRLAIAAYDNGDWGLRLDGSGAGTARSIQAYGVPDLLRLAGWSQLDMVKCDIEGAEAQVFADKLAPWLRHLDIAVIEIHQAISPRAEQIVSACFDPALFERQAHGEASVFLRRAPLCALPAAPREIRLLHSEPGTQPLGLQDVPPAGYGFFTFDGDSCQLHPNPPGGKPARVIFPCALGPEALHRHAASRRPVRAFHRVHADPAGRAGW